MIHYIWICFILAILGTLAVNPVFYFQIFKKRKEYREDLEEYQLKEKKDVYAREPQKSDYTIFDDSPIRLIIVQIILFALLFGLSALVLYFDGAVVVRFSTLLAYLWIPGIAQFATCTIIAISDDVGYSCFNFAEGIFYGALCFTCIFIVISSGIGIHKGVYNYLHPYNNFTIMSEVIKDCPKIDNSVILKEANIADGSQLKDPIYRNDNWIYPVVNYSDHVSSSGYIIVDKDVDLVEFIYRDMNYSPYLKTQNNVVIYLRRLYPDLVFFGEPSFQVNPDGGDIYFCQFYGDYACFRAGRNLKGILLVNATTGEYQSYSMGSIPSWVTGISF